MHYLINVDMKKPLLIKGTVSHILLMIHFLGYFSNMKLVTFGKQQFYNHITQIVLAISLKQGTQKADHKTY